MEKEYLYKSYGETIEDAESLGWIDPDFRPWSAINADETIKNNLKKRYEMVQKLSLQQ